MSSSALCRGPIAPLAPTLAGQTWTIEIAAPWVLGTSPRMTLAATLPAAEGGKGACHGEAMLRMDASHAAHGPRRERQLPACAWPAAHKASLACVSYDNLLAAEGRQGRKAPRRERRPSACATLAASQASFPVSWRSSGRRRRQGPKGPRRERRPSARATLAARKASLSSCRQQTTAAPRSRRAGRPSSFRPA